MENAVESFWVDIDPRRLFHMLQILIEVFPKVKLIELLIDTAYLLQKPAKLPSLTLLLLPVRLHAHETRMVSYEAFDPLIGAIDIDWEGFRDEDDECAQLAEAVPADDGEVVGEAVDAVQEVDVPPDLENLELPGLERVVLV